MATWRRALVEAVEWLADQIVPPTRRDEVSWIDPTNNDVVPREISWTISEETNYGGEHLTLRGIEEENAKARARLLGFTDDHFRGVDPERPRKRRRARAAKRASEHEPVSLAELDARLAPDPDPEPKAK